MDRIPSACLVEIFNTIDELVVETSLEFQPTDSGMFVRVYTHHDDPLTDGVYIFEIQEKGDDSLSVEYHGFTQNTYYSA